MRKRHANVFFKEMGMEHFYSGAERFSLVWPLRLWEKYRDQSQTKHYFGNIINCVIYVPIFILCKNTNKFFFLYLLLQDFQASQDISVAFFGLFWPHLFKEIERIQSTVEQMQKAQNHPTSSLLTLVMCRHLIFDLVKLEGDLHAHSEAVLSGRTSIKQKEHIR